MHLTAQGRFTEKLKETSMPITGISGQLPQTRALKLYVNPFTYDVLTFPSLVILVIVFPLCVWPSFLPTHASSSSVALYSP